MEHFYILIILFFLILYGYLIVREHSKNKIYLNELGAEKIKAFHLINWVKCDLNVRGIKAKVFTSGVRGCFKLNISVPIMIDGFLRLWRPDLLDKLFSKKTKNGLAIEFEDHDWANLILTHLNLESIFKKTDIHSIKIHKKNLVFSWLLKRNIREVKKESIFNALEELYKLSKEINNIPSSNKDKEDLRNFLSIKLPLFLTALLVLIGVFGKFWLYKPLCALEIILLGVKIYVVLFILYVITIIFMAGNLTFSQRIMHNAFVIFIISCAFVSLFFLNFLNGALDVSMPVLVRDKVSNRYKNIKRGKMIILENLRKRKKYCGEVIVSESFYEKVKIGDTIEYEVKKGFLGVEWIYSGFKLVKDTNLSNED